MQSCWKISVIKSIIQLFAVVHINIIGSNVYFSAWYVDTGGGGGEV
jgi:hypothetical protein